jgi:hypothetical protein
LAISHVESGIIKLDLLREWKAPHNPHQVIREAAQLLETWQITSICGDKYAGDFVKEAFKAAGIKYIPSEKSKSDIYLEILPYLCSSKVRLLDNDRLLNQMSSLTRISRSGGKDTVDHPQNGHDDLANAACGALLGIMRPQKRRVGALQDINQHGCGNRVLDFLNSTLP